MREKILSQIGLAVFLIGVVALVALTANGHSLGAYPGVFYIQAALSLCVLGVFIAWRFGAVLLEATRKEYLRRSFPNQPWMWRLDWSRRVSAVRKSTKNVAAWVATSWNLGITPLAVASMYTISKTEFSFYVCGAAVATGAALFGYALYRLWYRVRLDYPELRLHTNPGRLGRVFECTLGVRGLGEGMRWTAEMACVYSRVESVKVQTRYFAQPVTEDVWKQSLNPMVARSPRGAALALRYMIPKDAPATGPYKQGEVRWVVRIHGRNKAGILHFSHEYEVPIYQHATEAPRVHSGTEDAPQGAVGGLRLQQDKPAHGVGRKSAGSAPPQPGVAFAAKVDVPAMLGALKATGIRFSKGGVIYPDQMWDRGPLIALHEKLNKLCWRVLVGSLAVAVIILLLAPWYWLVPCASLAIAAVGGYATAFYIRNHRYSVIFSQEGVTRCSNLLSRKWKKTIPWSKIQTVVWKSAPSADGRQLVSSYRQLVINPDDKDTRLVLSPAIENHDAAEALVKLMDSVTRQFANAKSAVRRAS